MSLGLSGALFVAAGVAVWFVGALASHRLAVVRYAGLPDAWRTHPELAAYAGPAWRVPDVRGWVTAPSLGWLVVVAVAFALAAVAGAAPAFLLAWAAVMAVIWSATPFAEGRRRAAEIAERDSLPAVEPASRSWRAAYSGAYFLCTAGWLIAAAGVALLVACPFR